MSAVLGGQEVFVRIIADDAGDMVDAIVRAPDRATFDAVAVSVGLLVADEEGIARPARGVDIDHVGPVMTAPGEYDTRHHANIRLSGSAMETTDAEGVVNWHKWAIAWTTTGVADGAVNAAEIARVLHDVALIDPDSISSPARVWF